MKKEHVFDPTAVLRRVRHSRMLLAGIQAESGLDPRLKHSGVTLLESHLFALAAIFEGGHAPPLSFPACGKDEGGVLS
jgi:hypothetical protein